MTAPETDLLPHQRVRLWRLEDHAPAPTGPVVVCPMTEVELPTKGKRGDAFMAGSQLIAISQSHDRENARWSHRATYSRVHYSATEKKAARYVGTMAIRFARSSIWPWRFEHAVGYWRTGATGKYAFAWAACWLRDRDRVLHDVTYLSAAGLKGLLALPPGTPTKAWPETIAPFALAPAAPEDEDETDD